VAIEQDFGLRVENPEKRNTCTELVHEKDVRAQLLQF
jgi:hypothetical protein